MIHQGNEEAYQAGCVRWPQRFSRSGDRDEVAAISDPCILLQSELQINAYDRYRRAKDIAEASAHPEPSAHSIK
jgi:hypothetical protein